VIYEYHLGDPVQTPTGRPAEVIGVLQDGRLNLQYADREGGDVVLMPDKVRIVRRATRRWPQQGGRTP